MMGFGFDWYPYLDVAFMAFCVLYFLVKNGWKRWGLFGISMVLLDYVTVNNLVWQSLSQTNYLLLLALVIHLVPLWAALLEYF